MYRFPCILIGHFPEHHAYFSCCDIGGVGNYGYLLCNEVDGSKYIVALPAREGFYESPYFSPYCAKEIASHYEMRSIHKQQDVPTVYSLSFFH